MIKKQIGILYSLTGAMARSESRLMEATQMAVEEINQEGGILGHLLEPVVMDAASQPMEFTRLAGELLREDITTVFGCWTSLSRKLVLPLFEQYQGLLWYPSQYEGLEQSRHVFYTGACPNQQVEPAVHWLLQQGKTRFYLLGSDYVYPRTANKIIRSKLKQCGGEIVGERYVPLQNLDFTTIVQEIQRCQPDAVVNTLNSNSHIAFYRCYQQAGVTAQQIPVMAVVELNTLDPAMNGHYLCASYLQTVDTPENHRFVTAWQRRKPDLAIISDAVETAYVQVHLWRQAVEKAGSFAIAAVREAAYQQCFNAPSGLVRIETNHHVWKNYRIGQIQFPASAVERPAGRPYSCDTHLDAPGSAAPFPLIKILLESTAPMKPLPWLGVEEQPFATAGLVMDLLSEVAQGIQYSWQLEQKSRALQEILQQLEQEIHERRQAQQGLLQANEEISRLNEQLKNENLRMGTELEITRRLQQMILPKKLELDQINDLEIASFMEPATEVGGDYYDVWAHNGQVKIGIGDVTGHGLESGVLMLMVQTAVRTLLAYDETDPVRFLSILNRTIYGNVQRMNSDRNLTLSLIDYQAGQVKISGQHEEVIVVRADGTAHCIGTMDLGFPVGFIEEIDEYVAQTQLGLNTGDGLVLYTDGITEAENVHHQFYGLERLVQVIRRHWQASAHAICQAVITDVKAHIGTHKVYDDITLLVIKKK